MQKVFLVLKNSDFTEGRGPMIAHLLFETREDAHKYVMDQPGIYGSVQMHGTYGGDGHYNGYEVKEMFVMKYEEQEEFQKQQTIAAALKKLTAEEKLALGLAP